MSSLHHNPTFRALPTELQARLEVALTLGAQAAALRSLTDDLNRILEVEAPGFAFGIALDIHVSTLETYFRNTVSHALGAGWRR